MGVKLLWTGLFIFFSAPLIKVPDAAVVGAVVMFIGLVLMWLDK
jgi:uncharacterized membrane protein YczE